MVGRSRSAVSNLLRLLGLAAPVRELLQAGKLDMGHGRALLALLGMQQMEVANTVVAKNLSVRETEKLVANLVRGIPGKAGTKQVDRDVMRLQEEMAQKLGTKVEIKSRNKNKGSLVIQYTSLAQLDAILARLNR
jgi:ParB family chromosome partitioning protein